MISVPLHYRAAARLLPERQYHGYVNWMFFHRFRWKCRVRLHHTYVWSHVDGWHCSRCSAEKGTVRLLLFWSIPGVRHLSFRIKHGRWN